MKVLPGPLERAFNLLQEADEILRQLGVYDILFVDTIGTRLLKRAIGD